jgi:HK97 family phage portal protein
MGLLDIARAKNVTFQEWLNAPGNEWAVSRSTDSGVSVSPQSAMKFATVWACIRLISETLATVPLKVYRKRRDGRGRDEATDHPLFDVLNARPNEEMPAVTYRETKVAHVLQCGNGYSFPTRNGREQVVSLYPVPWTQIYPFRDVNTNKVFYRFNDRGKEENLPASKVFHLRGLGFDGMIGYSPIGMHMQSIGLAMAQEKFAALFFGNGANIGGILTVAGLGNKESRDKLREEIEEKFGSLGKSHRLMVLADGSQYHRIAMPLSEAQFIEGRDFQTVDIARIFGMSVALHLLGVNDKAATFASVEQFAIAYVVHVIRPWAVRFEQYANAFLLSPGDRAQGYFVEHNLDGLLRGDAISRAKVLQIMRQSGIITANEWRGLDNWNPLPPEQGDVVLVNGALVPVELAGKVKAQNGGTGGDKDDDK